MTSIDVDGVRDAVRKKYVHVARTPEGRFQYPVGRAGALAVGYDPALLAAVPEAVLSFFCGVGNPFALGAITAGDAVLDVGCGAGIDLVIAQHLAGPRGRASGVDLIPEMADRARLNVGLAGAAADVVVGAAEALPYDDGTFDVVISNGSFNLSPLKAQSFGEVWRVLRPGGRLQCADIVLQEALPPEVANSLEAWSE
ncbi:MAG: methyltransferase domain-containing protein [Candidatus Rokubacteria bacterium]|nr:methyltransferase domain-containing protein [Candidatus Rokubacteria bacterium]